MTAQNSLFTYLKKVLVNKERDDYLLLEISTAFKSLELHKNEYFVKEGTVCKYFCFIESGVLQHSIDISGENKTTYLALKNSCTAALKSFVHKIPSRKNIKALSNCMLLVITHNDFKQLLNSNSLFHQFYFSLIENQIFLIDDYRIDLLTLTPEERYHKMLLTEPNLLQEVPLHYLASFLGISTRHMSRIRKNIK